MQEVRVSRQSPYTQSRGANFEDGHREKVAYAAGAGVKEVLIEDVNPDVFREILATLAEGKKENKAAFKVAEVWCYGSVLSTVQIPPEQVEDSSAT
jgi:hypothetical protein